MIVASRNATRAAVLCLLLAVCILALSGVVKSHAAVSEPTVKEVEECLEIQVMKLPLTLRDGSAAIVFVEVYQNNAREGRPLSSGQPISRTIRKPVTLSEFRERTESLEDPFVLVIVDDLSMALFRLWMCDKEQLVFSASAGFGYAGGRVSGYTVSVDLTEFVEGRDLTNAYISGGPLPIPDLSTSELTPVYVMELCWDKDSVYTPDWKDLEELAKYRDLVVAVTVQVTY